MKSYAYLREHVKGVLAQPPMDTNDSLSHLAYYLFAPTLVYQDSFKRLSTKCPMVGFRADYYRLRDFEG